MDAPRELKLTLPPDLAQAVREKVVSGGYTDEMEVIRDGLAAITEDENHLEDWMVEEIRETYAEWEAGTLETVSMEEIRAEIAAERAAGC